MIFSVVNWRRHGSIAPNIYGIAYELSAETHFYYFKKLSPKIRIVGVVYSNYNSQWFNLAVSQARKNGLTLRGEVVNDSSKIIYALKKLLTEVDAIWLITDTNKIVSEKANEIFKETAAWQKPVFTNDTKHKGRAVLTITANLHDIGRQAGRLALDILKQKKIHENVQSPKTSDVIVNQKKADGIKINPDFLLLVDEEL